MKRRTAVLFSGRGSNLAALIAAAADPGFPAAIVLALTNNHAAEGRALADAAGIPCRTLDHRPHGRDRAAHEAAIHDALTEAGAELVCLAGYMRLLTPFLVDRWAGRMLNIHPSLLPAFPGLHTHARALQAGVKLHGCSVHFVTQTMDSGPIIAQAAIPVLPEDTEASLAARVLAQEHVLYPLALRLAAGAGPAAADPAAALVNPPPPVEFAVASPASTHALTDAIRAALRRATPQDAAAVRDLTRAAYAQWVPILGREAKPMTADYDLAVRDHIVDMLHVDGALAALIEMHPEADHLLVVNVAVSPACQGRGYGRALLAYAEEYARSLGLREMRLYTSCRLTENVKLYERVGYKVDREEETSPHLGVFVYMSKHL